ncbi:hypothetical protein [Psittacicella hinzii]|uniref:Uncharacterized protein n=1 Tax=Psittacicella hinzii TaxID=2028575 RepID=A0A3A1YTU5_9GAMM|nr:hypothetical protein [Psittacicella hinzii]RIY40608.1 hypothetical protein CKF58_00380 [Psittacicella hinzii]
MDFASPSFIIVAVLVLLRCIYNYRDPHFEAFAFSLTFIILQLITSLISPKFFYSSFLYLDPYKPLLVVTLFFLAFLLIYRFICSQFLHTRIRRNYHNFTILATIYSKEILIFTEVVASFLAYISLADFPQFKSWLLTSTMTVNYDYSRTCFGIIAGLMVVRFIWNILLGSYKTLCFWLIFSALLFVLSIVGHREYFAANIFLSVYIMMFAFRYVCTEENFYLIFARSKLSESRFAMLVHGATALAELIGSLMVIWAFVNSYADLAVLKSVFY